MQIVGIDGEYDRVDVGDGLKQVELINDFGALPLVAEDFVVVVKVLRAGCKAVFVNALVVHLPPKAIPDDQHPWPETAFGGKLQLRIVDWGRFEVADQVEEIAGIGVRTPHFHGGLEAIDLRANERLSEELFQIMDDRI